MLLREYRPSGNVNVCVAPPLTAEKVNFKTLLTPLLMFGLLCQIPISVHSIVGFVFAGTLRGGFNRWTKE